MPTPTAAVAMWDEHPLQLAASTLGVLTAYLLTDGSVEFLSLTDAIPIGAVVASVADSGDGTDEIVTPAVPTGRRVIESDSLFFL